MSKTFINPMDWQDFLYGDSDKEDWSFELTNDDVKRLCKHEFVEVGFMHSKIVCKHCDIEKEEWDKFIAKEKIKSNTYFA